jgi:hypothetical protein
MYKFELRVAVCLVFLCIFSGFIFAQNEIDESQKTGSASVDKSDPTMIRANSFIGRKPSEAFVKYQKLRKEFLKDKSREDQIGYNRWEGCLFAPIFVAGWKQEWQKYPESRIAFALYIRNEVKGNKHLRAINKLNPNLDDETLFHNYLDFQIDSIQNYIKSLPDLELKLGITEELKMLACDPESHLFIGNICSHYINVQSVKKLTAQIEAQEATAAEARRKLVPVERTNKKYRDAFRSYKEAIAKNEQTLKQLEQTDPTWILARSLILVGKVGQVGSTSNLIYSILP